MTTKPILISGGGIGGCACALALSNNGFTCQVFEQSTEFSEIGAGIQLGPNVHKMFKALGIDKEIEKIAFYPDNLIMRDALNGKEITRVDLGKPFLERFKAPYGVIHRADLHKVIYQSCLESENIDLLTSVSIVDFEEYSDGVRAIADDGTSYDGMALIGAY